MTDEEMEPDNISREIKNLPIDKGYAWVVCFGAGVIYLFSAGGIRVWGIHLLHWQDQYGLTATEAITITAVTNITMAVLCPLMSAIGNAYSERKVMFLCGFLVAVGTMVTGFCNEKIGLTFAFGVTVGIGQAGLISSPVVTVGLYFDARRSLGNAMFSLGGSLGQLLLPSIITFLFMQYDPRGAIIIFGALFLNILPAALLCRPLSFYERKTKKVISYTPKSDNLNIDDAVDKMDSVYTTPIVSHLTVASGNTQYFDINNGLSLFEEVGLHKKKSFLQKIGSKPLGAVMSSHRVSRYSDVSAHQCHCGTVKQRGSGSGSGSGSVVEHVIYKHCPFHHNDMHEVVLHSHNLTKNESGLSTYDFHEPYRLSIRSIISPMPSLKPLAIVSMQNLSHTDAKKMGMLTPSSVRSLDEDKSKRRNITPFNSLMTLFCSCCPVNEDPNVFPLYDWVLLRNRLYVLFVTGSLLSTPGYFNVFVLFPSFCKERGFNRTDIAIILSVLAIGDLVGRIFIGIVGDKASIKRYNILLFVVFIMGVITVALPYSSTTYGLIVIYCVVFSFLGGMYLCLLAVVCVDLLGIAELSGAYGLSFMFDGLFYFPVTITLGFAQDKTGKNDVPIMICGAIILAGGAIFALLNCVDTSKHRTEHVHLRRKKVKP